MTKKVLHPCNAFFYVPNLDFELIRHAHLHNRYRQKFLNYTD
jgi:hypothetical protein